MSNQSDLYLLFADLLEYPSIFLRQQAQQSAKLLAASCPSAEEPFSIFMDWVQQEPLSRLEEIYTSTFDLQGICCLYVGHQLFGDNYQRSWFMARLNEAYYAKGYSTGCELPDHLAVILRFLAGCERDEFSQVLLEEGLVPAVSKMIQAFDVDGAHPYRQLLNSLSLVLADGQLTSREYLVRTEMGGL
jgi:nitrate reductase delta subunit